MARVSTTGPWSAASTNEAFRALIAEVEQMLGDCGLVKTADTGQLDPATAVIPGVSNTDAGFTMWRFNDSLQTVAPIFIKCVYGRSGTNQARFGIQVGSGTDGAGNITGPTHAVSSNTNGAANAGMWNSYAIHREGMAALIFKLQSSPTPFSFVVQRTVDNSGAPTADGALVMVPDYGLGINNYGRFARLRFSPTADTTDLISSSWLGMIAGNITDSRVGLSPQVFPHWAMLPKQMPVIGTAAHIRGEINVGEIYPMTLVGSGPKNYLCVGHAICSTLYSASGVYTDLSILWED